MRRTTLIIADRHPIVREGLASVLAAQLDFTILAACEDGVSCIEAMRRYMPDIAILEPLMPDIGGREILALVKSEGLATRVIFFTTSAERSTMTAEGVHSVLTKDADPEMLLRTLRRVAQGLPSPVTSREEVEQQGEIGSEKPHRQLTERERQIMRLVSEGLSNKEIGRRLNVANGTIKVHLHHIFQKLDISNRTVLAALAISRHETRLAPLETDPYDSPQDNCASTK
ncbi:LuxR C-terminal-related transcriptional regulator [Bradyrhizobium sp. UFLA05-112]